MAIDPLTLSRLRSEYSRSGLTEADCALDPFEQVERWFGEAIHLDLPDANAASLATADASGQPRARTVLVKGLDEAGVTFFTNYQSRKGQDLAENPRASLLLFWGELQRQVRFEGRVEKTTMEESDAYFAERPRGSQLGAWASPQSRPIAGREALERDLAALEARFAGGPVPRPPYWGGYRLVPHEIEVWQGRESRLHDRFRFTREGAGWRRERLGP